jgi:hypothetical protein
MKQGPLTLTQDDCSTLCEAVKSHIYCEASPTFNITSTNGSAGNDVLHELSGDLWFP